MNIAPLVALGRRLLSGTLIDAGVISDYARTHVGGGNYSETWTPRSGTTACRLVREKDQLVAESAGVVTGPSTPILLMAVGVDFDERDRIVVNGQTYQCAARISANSVTVTIQRFIVREV